MDALLLLAAGGLFALLFVLNALIHTIRRTERIGFWETLLVFLVTLVLLAALLIAAPAMSAFSIVVIANSLRLDPPARPVLPPIAPAEIPA